MANEHDPKASREEFGSARRKIVDWARVDPAAVAELERKARAGEFSDLSHTEFNDVPIEGLADRAQELSTQRKAEADNLLAARLGCTVEELPAKLEALNGGGEVTPQQRTAELPAGQPFDATKMPKQTVDNSSQAESAPKWGNDLIEQDVREWLAEQDFMK